MSRITITITIDKVLDDKLEETKANRSKLINFLIDDYFKKKKSLKYFKRK